MRIVKNLPSFLVLFIFISLAFQGCGTEDKDKPKEDFSISYLVGRYLWSTEGQAVGLVGVYIPLPGEANYNKAFYEEIKTLLNKKDVQIYTVEEKHSVGYPAVDLVEVYLEGVNINKHLLESGKAFFNEDHWDGREKKIYRQLEAQAQENKLGVWKEGNELKFLYVRPSHGRFVHFPDCHHVKNLKEKEMVKYYAPVPRSPFMAVRNAYFCDHCRPKFEAERQALENSLKLYLQS